MDLSVRCAQEAVKHGVDKFIQVSTAQVYEAGSVCLRSHTRTLTLTAFGEVRPLTKFVKLGVYALGTRALATLEPQ